MLIIWYRFDKHELTHGTGCAQKSQNDCISVVKEYTFSRVAISNTNFCNDYPFTYILTPRSWL